MLALSKRTPKEKRTKTRSGCKACKVRRIKCDETLPGCDQCRRRKVQCPGYTPKLKWSYKYEKLRTRNPDEIRWEEMSTSSEANIQVDFGPCYPSPPSIVEHDASWMPSLDAASEPYDDSLEEVNFESPLVGISSALSHVLDITPWDFNIVSLPLSDSFMPSFWSPGPTSDAMVYSPALELHYFSQRICACLCACDSPSNIIRSVTVSKVRISLLYQSLLKYLVTAYLNNNDPVYSTKSLVREARVDTLHSLQEGMHMLIHGGGSKILLEDILLAMIMYGLTTSWDGSNDTGAQHYEGAMALYSRGEGSMSSSTRFFLSEMLVYWWTGLSFVTDLEAEALTPPPSIEEDRSQSSSTKHGPHPLTGISPQVHILLGKVGSILYTQRTRALKTSFTSKRAIKQEQEALGSAHKLEEELLAMQIPTLEITDAEAFSTPVADLRNTAEAYQLCGLLLLYRGIPDLLQERMSVLEEGSLSAQLWLSSLALHILDVLSRNGTNSATRSVEQILLVIIAGELHMLQDQGQEFSWLPGPEQSFLTIDYPQHALTIETISQARSTVMQRLAAVRSILPYRSLGQVEELILEVWRKGDAGEQVFWMDIMIRNGWKFVMA